MFAWECPDKPCSQSNSKTFLARLCEQAERYEEMVGYMKVSFIDVLTVDSKFDANEPRFTGSRQRTLNRFPTFSNRSKTTSF